MAQTQITKSKPAAKTATKAKPATKTAPKGKTPAKTATKPAPGAQFAIRDGFRPGAGRLLFAYTFAWLQETGLIDGGSIPRADAVRIAGATAIGYHVNNTGRLIDNAGAISLAPSAANFFADRPGRTAKDTETFIAILRTGAPDGEIIKSAAGIIPIKTPAPPAGAGK